MDDVLDEFRFRLKAPGAKPLSRPGLTFEECLRQADRAATRSLYPVVVEGRSGDEWVAVKVIQPH